MATLAPRDFEFIKNIRHLPDKMTIPERALLSIIDRLNGAEQARAQADCAAAEQVHNGNHNALDRVCGVYLNDGRALETVLSADECQRIVDAVLNAEQAHPRWPVLHSAQPFMLLIES